MNSLTRTFFGTLVVIVMVVFAFIAVMAVISIFAPVTR